MNLASQRADNKNKPGPKQHTRILSNGEDGKRKARPGPIVVWSEMGPHTSLKRQRDFVGQEGLVDVKQCKLKSTMRASMFLKVLGARQAMYGHDHQFPLPENWCDQGAVDPALHTFHPPVSITGEVTEASKHNGRLASYARS